MNVGECYLIKTPPNGKHCFVVSLKIYEDQFLLLPISTQRENSESCCVIEPDEIDFPFVNHTSIIAYSHAKEFTHYALQDATQRGYCTSLGSLKPELLDRILQSALHSKRLKNRWKELIRKQIGS
ncbi:MAG: hypothetical protein AAF546_08400 [Verrucomicrobiota bacterium]